LKTTLAQLIHRVSGLYLVAMQSYRFRSSALRGAVAQVREPPR
jgi:hypothetical protein